MLRREAHQPKEQRGTISEPRLESRSPDFWPHPPSPAATLTTPPTCYLLSFAPLYMLLGSMHPWLPSQFVLAGKFTKSAYFLLSSDLFSWHTLSSSATKKIKDSWKIPRAGSEPILLPFPITSAALKPAVFDGLPKAHSAGRSDSLCPSSPLPQIPQEET